MIRYLFRQALGCGGVLDCPRHRLNHQLGMRLGLVQSLSVLKLQLLGHVLQDVHLQRGQRGPQVRRAHVALRQPQEQRLWKLSTCIPAAVEEGLQLLAHLGRHLRRDLGKQTDQNIVTVELLLSTITSGVKAASYF